MLPNNMQNHSSEGFGVKKRLLFDASIQKHRVASSETVVASNGWNAFMIQGYVWLCVTMYMDILLAVQMDFAGKYGTEFVVAATELMPECGVNRQVMEYSETNTCFWKLVESGKQEEAHVILEESKKGKRKQAKTEILFNQFGINYKNLPDIFRQGSCILRTEIEDKRKNASSIGIKDLNKWRAE
ncbi:tRNAHis guanylyltransferase Thg1 [Artemisia annua]|uniref:tRNAHis guanylyltransferase Thg1 n=1 Tax=Artemisia annua TaxID=35608 RepID=A0A2U1NMD8_ARTAN|nr:tRNAHis guanylyltransferase Thg1 [Artemisia annua]